MADTLELSEKEALISKRGTSSSGNWGHTGRPGKKGGSTGGGGHARIGVNPKKDNPKKIKDKAKRFKESQKQTKQGEKLFSKVKHGGELKLTAGDLDVDVSIKTFGGAYGLSAKRPGDKKFGKHRLMPTHEIESYLGQFQERKALHQAQTYKAGNTGAMICFFPGYNFAEDLAIPGASESPDDLHLTLAYLGEAKDIEHPERLLNFVASFALAQFPIRGKLNGIARFVGTDNENDPAVCLYDSPALPQFRQDLVNGLKGVGIYPVENHGFIPHITLDYIPPEKPIPYTVTPLPLNFYAVWVVLGETRFEYQLTGENMSGEWVKRTLTSEPLAVTGLTIMESIVVLQGEEDEVLGLFVKGDQFYANVGDWVTQATLDAVMEVLPGVEIEAEAPPLGDGWTQLWPPLMAAKAGARNSRIDKGRIQAVHDLMCELGAECKKPESYPMKSAANGESKNLSPQNYAGLIGLSQAMVKKKLKTR